MTPSKKHAQSRCERLAHPTAPQPAPNLDLPSRVWARRRLARWERMQDKAREAASVPPPSAPFGHGIGE